MKYLNESLSFILSDKNISFSSEAYFCKAALEFFTKLIRLSFFLTSHLFPSTPSPLQKEGSTENNSGHHRQRVLRNSEELCAFAKGFKFHNSKKARLSLSSRLVLSNSGKS